LNILKDQVGSVENVCYIIDGDVSQEKEIGELLEKYGAEVVDASVAEWGNYVSYDGARAAKAQARLNLKQLRFSPLWSKLKEMLGFRIDLYYKEFRQDQVYKRVQPVLDLIGDHKISHLEEILKEKDLFSFDVATEACLSIASISVITWGRTISDAMRSPPM
jgi:hypothetical protein